MAEMMRVKFI